MKTYRAEIAATLAAVLCLCVVLVGCGAGSSTGTVAGGNTPTTAPTTPPKNKPTTVPTVTMAFCQHILTIAEANMIMQPATQASSIRIDSAPTGGSCNYEYKPFNSVVTVVFLPYPGPTDPQSEQAGLAAAASNSTSSAPGATVNTTKVTDVGDAALFIAAMGNSDGTLIHQDTLDVIYGKVLISCGNFNAGSASDSSQLSALHQIAALVVSRM